MKPKTPAEIDAMRQGGRNIAAALDLMARSAKPGMTTAELEQIGIEELLRLGSQPVPVEGYPAKLCVSVNDEVVHGIPGNRTLEDGDVVGIDLWASYGGMVADSAITIKIGEVSKDAARLVRATKRAMYAGIDVIKPGVHIGDIGAAIQSVLEESGLGIVRDLAGHGVGHSLHEDPWVPNFGRSGTGPILKSGMTIAIEPMATLGGDDVVFGADGWTVSTADQSLAAHFEHTVLVTDDGYEILTA